MTPLLAMLLAGCSPGPDAEPDCGWDLRTDAGREANSERLTFANQWIASNPGQAVPAPTSSFWHGDCAAPTQAPPPPVDEQDQPDG